MQNIISIFYSRFSKCVERALMAKIRRNEKCPCRSGKKYKKCCLGKDASLIAKASDRFGYRHSLTYEEVDELSTDEILEKPDNLGIIIFDEKEFLKEFLNDIENYDSALDISESWRQLHPINSKGRDKDFHWLAACVL